MPASVTSTLVDTVPTSSFRLAVVVRFNSIAAPFRVPVANPLAEAETSYVPGGRLPIRYSPLAFVIPVNFTLVAVFVADTVTLGSAALLASSTVPTKSPLMACP